MFRLTEPQDEQRRGGHFRPPRRLYEHSRFQLVGETPKKRRDLQILALVGLSVLNLFPSSSLAAHRARQELQAEGLAQSLLEERRRATQERRTQVVSLGNQPGGGPLSTAAVDHLLEAFSQPDHQA